jgi:hypothetical protein
MKFVPSHPRPLACLTVLLGALAMGKPVLAFDWQDSCRPFIAPAETYYRLPAGLLAAMAVVESGRKGIPYPWALNIAGQPVMAEDYAGAARLLRERDGSARRDIAIGCLQIHMGWHLQPFGAPEWALHPRYNVWYAALFLSQLRQRYGTWVPAIAHYHASDPIAQRTYLCRIADQLQRTAPETRRGLGLSLCRPVPGHEEQALPPPPLMTERRRGGLQIQADAPPAAVPSESSNSSAYLAAGPAGDRARRAKHPYPGPADSK